MEVVGDVAKAEIARILEMVEDGFTAVVETVEVFLEEGSEGGGTVIFRVDRDLSFAYDKGRNCMRERLG